jgi:hypothetical protein
MSEDAQKREEGFFNRWSRLKTDVRETQALPAAEAPPAPVAQPEDELPELPSVDTLTMDSDFRGFLHPKVDEDLRRSALRKLFSDPHFNVMDGLDTYIDDYSVSEPIPAAMLAGMKQAQRILRWAEGHDDEETVEAADAETVEAAEEPRAIEETPAQDAPAAIDSAASESPAPAADCQPLSDPLSDPLPDALLDPLLDPTADPSPPAVAKPA